MRSSRTACAPEIQDVSWRSSGLGGLLARSSKWLAAMLTGHFCKRKYRRVQDIGYRIYKKSISRDREQVHFGKSSREDAFDVRAKEAFVKRKRIQIGMREGITR